jgi:hypothetical protein
MCQIPNETPLPEIEVGTQRVSIADYAFCLSENPK